MWSIYSWWNHRKKPGTSMLKKKKNTGSNLLQNTVESCWVKLAAVIRVTEEPNTKPCQRESKLNWIIQSMRLQILGRYHGASSTLTLICRKHTVQINLTTQHWSGLMNKFNIRDNTESHFNMGPVQGTLLCNLKLLEGFCVMTNKIL